MIFVCTGNTCRSLLAQAAWNFLTKNRRKDVKGLKVTTSGLAPRLGEPPAQQAIQIAQRWGTDISAHRAEQLDPDVARDTEWLIVMTKEQEEALKAVYKVKDSNIMMLGTFCNDPRFEDDIPDPHGESMEAYETCADHIRCGIQGLVRMICGE